MNQESAIVPSKNSFDDPVIVGIGASAGGIEALTEFFKEVPPESGIAYVVILHLSPDYDSQLTQILQQVARIPITKVTERVKVLVDNVYVVPPNRHLQMEDGSIIVVPNMHIEERRAPVDIFFRTLAETHGPQAIAVILSGTGANGSMGLKRIKENGGGVFVQNPREATFSDMPRHAIGTDLVDEVLPVAQIPARLLTYRQRLGSIIIPVEAQERPEEQQQALREVFTQLRLRTGHDFSNYKRATLLRRLSRRIHVRNLPDLPTYVTFLRENPEEVHLLLKDLLISVTNFFRDAKVFSALEQDIIPTLVARKKAGDTLRIWVAGCATGEEAYSLAMLLSDATMGVIDTPGVQIFATDIDEEAIATAREGLYTINDAADVSPERLRRYFSKEGDEYRVRREIWELVLFAHHNVLKDPPFSRLDLVSCRNLLIYLNQTAQERVLETFHFALNPEGYLLLGQSETVDGSNDLYTTLNREYHLYRSRQVSARPYPVPESIPALPAERKRLLDGAVETESRPPLRISYGELHQQLLEQYAPPSIIVNEEYDILHLSERAGRYLHITGGEPTKNLFKLIRPELRLELRTAFIQAMQRQTNVDTRNLTIRIDEQSETLIMHVRPVLREGDPARGFILVLFESVGAGEVVPDGLIATIEPTARHLEDELVRVKGQLRASNEHYELQAEELKASNEELQAMNEELRSAAEELETGKEELQSINEELITVNQEMKIKVEEISLTSNNLQNLINATDIATLFLDRSLRVNLFTPAARQLFNLIPTDLGRQLTDLTNRLENQDIPADAAQVMATLQPIERQARTTDGQMFIMRVLPYRTADDHINGVVVTFVNITQLVVANNALGVSEEQFRLFVSASSDTIYKMSPDWQQMLSLRGGDFLAEITNPSTSWLEQYIPPDDRPTVDRAIQHAIKKRQLFELEYRAIRADGSVGWTFSRAIPVLDRQGQILEWFGAASDITARKQAEAALLDSEKQKAFLLKLTDSLRPLSDPAAIQYQAACILGEALGASRVGYAEAQNEAELVTVARNYVQDVPTLEGVYPYVDYGPGPLWAMQTGQTIVRPDVAHDPTLTDEEKAAQAARQLGAAVDVPLVKQGRLVAILFVHFRQAHAWSAQEIALIEATAERTWATAEQARAEEALRKSEERLRLLIESANDFLILTLDAQGLINGWSEGARRLLGWTADEVIGQPGDLLFTPEDRAAGLPAQELQTARQQGRAPDEREYLRKDGSRFYASGVLSLMSDGTQGFVKIARDITERRRREERTAFLAEVSEAIAGLITSEEIMRVAGEKIVGYYRLSRLTFSYIDESNSTVDIVYDWHEPVYADVLGTYPIADFVSPAYRQSVRVGQTMVVHDVMADPRMAANQATYQTFGQGALLVAPQMSDGRWRFALALHKNGPYDWRTDQIELLNELAPRLYLTLERLRLDDLRRLTLLQQTEDLAKIGSWEYNRQTNTFSWSDGMYALLGMTPTQATPPVHPEMFLKVTSKEDLAKAQRLVAYLRDGEGPFETDLRIRVGGQVRTLRIKADVIGEGDQIRVVGVDLDITDQLTAQQQIQETAKNLQAVLDGSPAAIGLLKTIRDPADKDQITDFQLAVGNRKLAQFFKQPLKKLLGKSAKRFSQLLWDGKTFDVLRQIRQTGEARYDELFMDDSRWLAVATTRQDDGVLITALDITDLKTTQEQQQHWLTELETSRQSVEALGELRASLQHRSELLRAISHDLRGNFGIINGAVHLLTFAASEAERAQMMDMVLRNVKQATEMLTDLLDYSRLEAGQEKRTLESFDVTPVLQGLSQSMQVSAEGQGLRLESDGPPTLVVEGDRLHLYRMAQNLTINAIKYTRKGSVTIAWGNDPDRAQWWFSVSDTGPGIDAGMVARLNANEGSGQPATATTTQARPNRPDSPEPTDSDGSGGATPAMNWTALRGEGIGLRIVQQLATLLDAQLDVRSEIGKGTRFIVRFPLRYR